MILKLKGIQKKYINSRGRALKGLSIKLKKGQILSLQGESGSGKSTLLKIIAGMTNADKGSMKFHETSFDIQETNLIKEFKSIRMIDQDSTLPENISIRQAISRRLFEYKKTWVKNRISHLSELCQLRGLLDRNMDEISGGQRQRAALALAIADEPDILLLDEAFTSLDFSLKREIQMQWISAIRKEGISCIMVTHDPRDSLMYSDIIYILKNGKIIEKGIPEDIYKNPGSLYTAELFGPATELSINGKKIYLRPEQIELNKNKGQVKVELIEEYYTGNGYLYIAESSKKVYRVHSSDKKAKGSYYLEW